MNDEEDWNLIHENENVTVSAALKGSFINFKHPLIKAEIRIKKDCKYILIQFKHLQVLYTFKINS